MKNEELFLPDCFFNVFLFLSVQLLSFCVKNIKCLRSILLRAYLFVLLLAKIHECKIKDDEMEL